MAQFASDSFTGTAGNTLPTYSANWVAPGYSSSSWVISDANRARSSGANSVVYFNAVAAGADFTVQADLYTESSTLSDSCGVLGRQSTSAATYYLARGTRTGATSLNWQLFKAVAGVFTQLGSNSAQTIAADTSYEIKLSMVGTTIELYDEGGGSPTISATDSAIDGTTVGGLYAGLRNTVTTSNTTGYHIDNFSADDVGGGSASSITAAAGTATASTVAASSTAASAITSATGAATASTLTGSAVVAGAITAAAGVGTGGTLVGDTLAAGSAAIVAAGGVATTATLGGSSVAAAAIGVAAGAATAATVSGYDITPVVPDVTSVGRRRKTRAQRLQDYDVPMPVEVLTSTVPSDKVIEPIAAPEVEPVPAKASKLAKPKPKKPDAPAPEVKAKAKSPTPKKPAAQVQAPEPVKAVAAPRPMMLSDILSAETMTPEEMVAAVKLLARIQLGPQLIRSTPKAKLIRA